MARHSLRRPGFIRRHRRAAIATAAVVATLATAGAAYAVTIQPGQRVIAGRVTDSGHYGAYKDGSADPGAAIWVHNYGTHCTDEGREELTALLYLQNNADGSCDVVVEPGPNMGGDWVVRLNPADPHTPADTPGTTTSTTAAPTTTTTHGETPEPDACEHAMTTNEVYLVHKGCSVKGDVQVSTGNQNGPWTTLYDDDPATGLVVSFTADTYVRAPWGANVTGRTMESIREELTSVGCVSGCTSIDEMTWPEGTSASTSTTGSTSTTMATGGSNTTTTSTTGSSTSSTTARDCGVTTIASGQTVTVPAGNVLDGDVKIDGQALNDNDPVTALRVVFNQSASVYAEWGASYVPSGCEEMAGANMTVKMWPSGSTSTTTTSATHNMTNNVTSTTSTTGSTTSTTAAPTTSTTPGQTDTCIAQITPGQTMTVKAGCHIQGDVMVDGVAKYDNLQETGLIVVLTKDAAVKAPWGASVSSSPTDEIKASMMMVGCGLPNGCASVNVVTV